MMIRQVSLPLAAILFLAVEWAPGNLQARMKASQEVPKTATIKVVLLNAPGINDEGSRWEIAYELRLANEITLWKAWKQRQVNGGSELRVGDFIKEGVFRRSLQSPKNREAIFHIPLSPDIQEKLRNQPMERVRDSQSQRTPEEIKQLKEQEIKSQVFMFYEVIKIEDAKLKKNFIIPASRSWAFGDHPDAQFEIKVEINSDGGYNIKYNGESSSSTKKRSD
jgi:hypothetical protein